jgi:hypothetical protein
MVTSHRPGSVTAIEFAAFWGTIGIDPTTRADLAVPTPGSSRLIELGDSQELAAKRAAIT